MIHIKGELYYIDDNVGINGCSPQNDRFYGVLAQLIASEIEAHCVKCKKSKLDDDENSQIETSLFIPKISFKAYFSDKECSLEDAENNQILLSVGALDVLQEWYGYSEWSIMGYDVVNFKLVSEDGEHDLEEIFKSYMGKYVHLVIDILEEKMLWRVLEQKHHSCMATKDADYDKITEFTDYIKAHRFYISVFNSNYRTVLQEFVDSKWEYKASSCCSKFA